MLAVNQMASAIGWINRLMVSIMISIVIKGIGVLCGKKWARDDFVLWQKPKIIAPAQSGIAIRRFIDGWVVGVKEYGKSPSRLVDPMKISEISIKDQVCPLELCIVIIICWREANWLLNDNMLIVKRVN
jgi:hypothetical protein